MTKSLLALIVSALAIVVLATLIMKSRSVGVNDFDAHYQAVSTLDQSNANYESLLDQISSARRDGRPIGSGVMLMRSLLSENKESLASAKVNSQAVKAHVDYLNELQNVIDTSAEITINQNIVGNALTQIRDNGPAEVQKLKTQGFEQESNVFFRLLLNSMAYGTPGNNVNVNDIGERLESLKGNGNLLSSSMVSMIESIEQVIEYRPKVDQSWQDLVDSSLGVNADKFRSEQGIAHATRIRDVDNSKSLLSIFSVMLFGGLGLLGVRLQRSYGEINEVNDQLVEANGSLESRVEERTAELEEAFDELKESQVQLVQAEKMSSLGQLVAGISHEINTPLLYLQSNQTLIKETLARVENFILLCHDKLIPRATPVEDKEVVRQRYVKGLQQLKSSLVGEEIKEDIEELLALTDDNIEGLEELTTMAQGLKDFSRLDRAPIDSFNVNDGIKRTLVIAKNVLKHKVEVVQEFGDVPKVSCSPSQINQIFLNLITNAAQAIEDSGTITIKTYAEKGYVNVAISDTGCGIPNEIMAKIRDPFFTTKEVGSGTGLGLSIVEEILSSHNGRLDIESVVGQGSTFTILLPVKSEVSKPELEGLYEEEVSAEESALAIEDAEHFENLAQVI